MTDEKFAPIIQFQTQWLFLLVALFCVGFSIAWISWASTLFVAMFWLYYYRSGDRRTLIILSCLTVAFLFGLAAWDFEYNYTYYRSGERTQISATLVVFPISIAVALLFLECKTPLAQRIRRLGMSLAFLLSLGLAGAIIAAGRDHQNPGSGTRDNIRQVMISVLNFEASRDQFPRNGDHQGNPLLKHSWRVQLLPYIGEQTLYERYDFDEPWNGPNNRELAGDMPAVYRGSLSANVTVTPFKLVSGDGTAFEDGKPAYTFGDLIDGVQTIAMIEDNANPVHWMEPKGISIDQAVEVFSTYDPSTNLLRDSLFVAYSNGIRFACFDGSIHGYVPGHSKIISEAHFTVAGGEPIKLSDPVLPTRMIKLEVILKFTLYCLIVMCSAVATCYSNMDSGTKANKWGHRLS